MRILIAAALAAAMAAPAAAETLKGSFTGASGHVVTGTATVEKVDGVWTVKLDDAFVLDGAPDPKVAFGDKRATDDTILAHLKSYKGAQSYQVPAHLNPADFKRVYIWCRRYSVPLGYADLKAE